MGNIPGLDYGTRGSTLARHSEDYMKSKTIKDIDGDEIIPTVFVDGPTWGSHIYGKRAKMGQAVYQCITSAKTQAMKKEAYTNEGVKYNPAYVISNEISHMISDMEESEGEEIKYFVATYPAYMDQFGPEAIHNYRKILEKNTKPGGSDRIIKAMIPEPVAAALALNSDMQEQKLLVCDIGGGTADLCIVEIRKEGGQIYISAHSVYGKKIGGDDCDKLFLEFFIKQLMNKGIAYSEDMKLLKELLAKCEEIKINMSTRRDERVEFNLFSNRNNKYVHFSITKEEHNAIIIQFWNEIKCLLDAYTGMIDSMQIDKVLLVGGPCSNVILQKYLKEYFSQGAYRNVKVIAHKEKTAVAIGAANYAHWVFEEQKSIHVGVQKSEEINVKVELECTDSLGIRGITSRGEYYIGNVIRSGGSFPHKSTRVFGLFENQEKVCLPVYWNESKDWNVKMEEGTYIGEIELDLSKFQIGKNKRIEVTISMPSQGIVNVEQITILDERGNTERTYQVSEPLKFIRRKGA